LSDLIATRIIVRRNYIIIAHWLLEKTVSRGRKDSKWLLQIWNRQLFLLLGIKNTKAFFFGLTRVNPFDPWPDHLTGSGFKTMKKIPWNIKETISQPKITLIESKIHQIKLNKFSLSEENMVGTQCEKKKKLALHWAWMGRYSRLN
jgi:hypothetical protein